MSVGNGLGHAISGRRWVRAVMLALSGLLMGVGVTFPTVGFVAWVALAPAIAVFLTLAREDGFSWRRLYGAGLLYSYSFSLVIFHWFWYMYPLDFTGLSRAGGLGVILLAWLGLSALQSMVTALIPLALRALMRVSVCRRYRILPVVLLAALFCLREWGQTHFWTGVPWGRLALSQSALPLMLQPAQWFGSYGITFVLVLVNGLIALMLLQPERLCRPGLIALCTMLLWTGSGAALLARAERAQDADTVRTAVIQGNIGSLYKWDISMAESFRVYLDLSVEAAKRGAELIVWPETAIPTDVGEVASFRNELSDLAETYEVTILVGAFASDGEGREYNAVYTVLPDGSWSPEYYAKRRLVPFGEYVPMRSFFTTVAPVLGEISMLAEDLTPGVDAAVSDTPVGRLGSLICFDTIYEALARDSVRDGAQLLCVSTNDSWFFDSAATEMHLAQSRLRAVETGRAVVHAATTGASALILPTGEIAARLPLFCAQVMYVEAPLRDGQTLYTRVGNAFVYVCLALCVAVAAVGVAEWGMTRRGEKSRHRDGTDHG